MNTTFQSEVILREADLAYGDLILVSNAHPWNPEYRKEPPYLEGVHRMNGVAAYRLWKLLDELKAQDRIVFVSAYRSREDQRKIYEKILAKKGEEFARRYVALPGCSEHETGLAIDLGERKPDVDFIRPDFSRNGIFKEFRERAAAYGFVERYGKEKESVTGIAYEPWHFRYVGVVHAEAMVRRGMCLEEYTDFLRGAKEETPIAAAGNAVTTVKFFEAKTETRIPLPRDPYRISGNNVDGFVRTTWRKR
jgi:D-alanyl-D-alanine dipeptidase/carboxypeptidase